MNSYPFDRGMIIRTVLLVFAWLNQFLALNGWSPLPFDDAGVELAVSSIYAAVVSFWAWWKDNDVTQKARRNKKVLKDKGLS